MGELLFNVAQNNKKDMTKNTRRLPSTSVYCNQRTEWSGGWRWSWSTDEEKVDAMLLEPLWIGQKELSTWTSQLVPHASTTQARHSLTSEFGWDPVLYVWYGRVRQRELKSDIRKHLFWSVGQLYSFLVSYAWTIGRVQQSASSSLAKTLIWRWHSHSLTYWTDRRQLQQ